MTDETPERASILTVAASMLMILQERHGLSDADLDAALTGALQRVLDARAGDTSAREFCQGALDRLFIAWRGVAGGPDKRTMN